MRRKLSFFLIVLLSAGILCHGALVLTAQAATHYDHCECGEAACTDESHTTPTWYALSSTATTLSGGNYYLSSDMNRTPDLKITGPVRLCLNGKKLAFQYYYKIFVESGASLTICDCMGGGAITAEDTNVIYLRSGETDLTLYGGRIACSDAAGTGAYAVASAGTGDISLYGGAVSSKGDGIRLFKAGTVLVDGAVITGEGNCGIIASCDSSDETVDAIIVKSGTVSGAISGIEVAHQYGVDSISILGGTVRATAEIPESYTHPSDYCGISLAYGSSHERTVVIDGGIVTGARYGLYSMGSACATRVTGGSVWGGRGGIFYNGGSMELTSGTVSSDGADVVLYRSDTSLRAVPGLSLLQYDGIPLNVKVEYPNVGEYLVKGISGTGFLTLQNDCLGTVYDADAAALVLVEDHPYGPWETETPATCTAEGLRSRSCTTCGKIDSEVLSMAEHTYASVAFHWAKDLSSATATGNCTVCKIRKNIAAALTWDDRTEGELTVTAMAIMGEEAFTDCRKITVQKSGEEVLVTLPEEATDLKVIAAGYDAVGKMLFFREAERDGTQAAAPVSGATIRLFFVRADWIPLSPALTVLKP